MKKISAGFIVVVALGLLGACSSSNEAKLSNDKDGKLEIVTTFYPMYDFTKNIVGDEANVELMVPAGSEPHDYEPSAKDMAKAHDADVFVYHNENMETWVPKAKENWKSSKPNVVEGTKDMILLPSSEEDHDHGEEGHHHELDPHTWVSPKMAIKEVANIKDQLAKLYPKKARVFETNAEKYLTKLKQLDADYTASLKEAKEKSFVTQHAAFGYLALDYGLMQVPIAGLSPEEEPSSGRLAELKDYVKKNKINYIYFEKNTNDKIAKTLANEAGIKTEVLNPLESLTKEQMDNGEDYVSVMEDNLKALEKTTTVSGEKVTPEKEIKNEKTVANGYFKDTDVKDRELSDYIGEWQSVYPLLKDGILDEVFEYKAKLNKDMNATGYKDYYTTGYKTDVDNINIKENTIDFVVKGEHHQYTYKYVGYKILNYEKGNRGVRFNFETDDAGAGRFKYVQFSDHGIVPNKAEHFHVFFGGDSQEKLYNEMHNWPTFYPALLSKYEIAQEMMAH
ncbi:zinc ABC transporter substrate-binding protein AdcA [Enterococcus hirae]|uniref:zinc ABC transporter substrate-binding protein AdcA n=1 Tax=Enterococcus hirae TaxID=1354 RepID=UPI001378A64E|nr:zinc ABC transporter substrate-binding protein AdcA [Enterococcus hirae]NBA38140.1 ZinT/AdcA family metal-binding protein [Enterococcus hirae]NBA56875.1 ZinT/AdcA family metal-binding protein [Enterococcus hirae]